MALIGRIRNNLWLVIVLVGLAMLGFLFMDMGGSNGPGGGTSTVMGKVDGEKIDYLQFDKQVRLRYGGSTADQYTLKNALWNSLVNETIVKNEGEKLGLTVSDSELESLVYGPNYSPIIIQDFPAQGQNPYQARTPDIEQLNQIKDLEASESLNPQYVPIWNEEKKKVKRGRMETKLVNLVSKSIYVPTWLAKMQHNDRTGQAKLAYVTIPFDLIANTEVTLEDADYKKYLEENKVQYTKDVAQQTLSYVTFEILPTDEDSADLKNQLAELIPTFEKLAENENKSYVESKQGIYNPAYVTKSDLADNVATNLFSADLGSTYGPYLEGDNYKVAKLLDRMIVPDSVSARHILRSSTPQDPASVKMARDTIMMIKKMIESGAESFDSLAVKYSQDPGSGAKGGDLGNFSQGTMVPEFNNACFFDKSEGLKVVTTQYGVHLIDVTKRFKKSNTTGVQIAYLQKPIVPSKKTTKAKYAEALRFANQHTTLSEMKKAAKDADLEFTTSNPVDANGFNISGLGTGESTRNMIKWANEAKVGEVSPTVYRYSDTQRFYENKYIIAAKASQDDAGLPSVASMKKTIENLVMNEKKGALIASQIQGLGSLADIAAKYGEVAIDSTNVTFSSSSPDPKLVAAAFNLAAGETSKPVVGNNGVYVATMITKPTPTEANNLASVKNQVSTSVLAKNRVGSALLPALKKETKIKDQRSDFF